MLQVDDSANGSVIELRVGQRMRVILAGARTAPRATTAGTEPTAPLLPLRTDQAQGFPVPPPASATFTAIRTGVATVTAQTDAACLHTRPGCMMAQRMFRITVRVQAVPGKGSGPLPVPPRG